MVFRIGQHCHLQWDEQKSSLSGAYFLIIGESWRSNHAWTKVYSGSLVSWPMPSKISLLLCCCTAFSRKHNAIFMISGRLCLLLASLESKKAIVIPGWQQFCLIHEQAMWYECMWHGRCSQQCNLKQHSWWHSDFFIISMLFFPPLKPKKATMLGFYVFFFLFPNLSAFLECPGVILIGT